VKLEGIQRGGGEQVVVIEEGEGLEKMAAIIISAIQIKIRLSSSSPCHIAHILCYERVLSPENIPFTP
jgi:hypothetical protein